VAGPLIVTALLGATEQAYFDRLRREHFPPERNQLAAHLTMFHAIPAVLEPELRQRLAALAAELPPPAARIAGLMNLGGGVAFRIVSDELDAIRAELADAFRGHLTQQDSHGWRPHIPVQNKVTSGVARALHDRLAAGFEPRLLELNGLAYDHYAGGPWLPGRRYPFRGR
jgi:hypothetical protein